ncbi:hypothetical protein ACHAWU_001916 [Discostella pseudostelligera]|uniref:Wings apart-like protein C-terminal domain-containing protein n=1 Tax=Discostella pseudostelligera TaxID=259834 RepID=A0ABD3MLS9_9STRA
MNPSPLKGRTLSKRSRTIIRTGADAVAEANAKVRRAELASAATTTSPVVTSLLDMDDDNNDAGAIGESRREPMLCNASNNNNSSSSSSNTTKSSHRRRHKRPKLLKSTTNTNTSWSSSTATANAASWAGDDEQERQHHFYLANDNDNDCSKKSSTPSSSYKSHHQQQQQFEFLQDTPSSTTSTGMKSNSTSKSFTSSSSNLRHDNIGTTNSNNNSNDNVVSSLRSIPSSSGGKVGGKRQKSPGNFIGHGTPKSCSNDDSCSSSLPSTVKSLGRKVPSTPSSCRNSQLGSIPEHGTPTSDDDRSTSIPSAAKPSGRQGPTTTTSFQNSQLDSIPEHGTPTSSNDVSRSTSLPSTAKTSWSRKGPSTPSSSQKTQLGSIHEHGTPTSSSDADRSTSVQSTSKTWGRKGPSTPSSSNKSQLGSFPEHGTPTSSSNDDWSSSVLSTAKTMVRKGPSTPSPSQQSQLDSIPEHGTLTSNDNSCSSSLPSTAKTMGRKGPSTPTSSNKSQRGKSGRLKESTPESRGTVLPSSSQESSSTSGTPQAVTLGGHRRFRDDTTTQDMGNYRMLIDDLSYLSSAIIQCRKKLPTKTSSAKVTLTTTSRRRRSGATLDAVVASHTQQQHHTAVTAGAACGIAELVSQSDTRVKLLTLTAKSARGGAKVGAVEAILESVACAPDSPDWSVVCRNMIENGCGSGQSSGKLSNGSTRSYKDNVDHHSTLVQRLDMPRSREYDIISSKALSIVSYFVGVDCTESAILSDGASNRLAIQLTRETVLQHKSALRGIARLVADDPVVNAYLHEASKPLSTNAGGSCCGDELSDDIGTERKPPAVAQSGRRSRKKRQVSDSPSSNVSSDLQSKSSLDVEPSFGIGTSRTLFCRGQSADMDFSFREAPTPEGHESDVNCSNKFDEKILLAMSRIKLTRDNDFGLSFYRRDLHSDCAYCSVWTPHLISHLDSNNKDSFTSTSGLALVAADCIITGRDRWSAESHTDLHVDVDDGLPFLGYSNEQHASHGLMAENPIVYANEMLRQSGSLPQYSRSMSETLLAILISMNSHGITCCSECTSYLQKRAFALSEVIDSLCCLSPNVSVTLSNHESCLVPSLLRVILEVSLSMNDDWPSLYVDAASAALKTLTSLTHENSVASGQMLASLSWESSGSTSSQDSTSTNHTTGVGIVFSYLFRTVSLMQTKQTHHKMMYDHAIFCLNILTNTVEMDPDQAKRVIEAIIVDVDGDDHQSGLSWLTRWIVSTTSGFRESVMKGSFGSSASTNDDNELKTGEDDNLVTAGNGFVLLAYLMIGDDVSSRNNRDIILEELPIDQNRISGGIQFIVKVLKAFCNYYHYTVGDISVAVIAPVVKLITGLELLDLQAVPSTHY